MLAYNLETILAEKLETVISREDQNTRPRDYYDVYILTKEDFEWGRRLFGQFIRRSELCVEKNS